MKARDLLCSQFGVSVHHGRREMKNKEGRIGSRAKQGRTRKDKSFWACSGDLLQSKLHVLPFFLSPLPNNAIMTIPRD